jgi:hypothetical protein
MLKREGGRGGGLVNNSKDEIDLLLLQSFVIFFLLG